MFAAIAFYTPNPFCTPEAREAVPRCDIDRIGRMARNPFASYESADMDNPSRRGLARLMLRLPEHRANDPDAHWRWLADGIQASVSLFTYHEPRFVIIGRDMASGCQASSL